MLALQALAATLVAAADPSPASGVETGYALIVTNNRSLDATRPDLHYADDDGAKYADLFSDVFGLDHVVLLTEFDNDSAPMYPGWVARSKPPTGANLDAAVTGLAAGLAADHASGKRTNLVFVFAGHGDIERGRGFVDLADAKLTAKDLEERVVNKLPTDRLHMILDSCNSYFMLSPRKPGGKRFAAGPDVADDLLARHPNVGAIVSTSAEAVTYEWSELQSGIFSYELRSALRGAADLRGDGQISYRELAAFIRVANEAVANDLYRPKIYARGPAGKDDEPLLALPSPPARELVIPKGPERRITLRDVHGTRLADVHTDGKTVVSLVLPASGEIGAYERVPGESGRPVDRFRSIPGGVSTLDALAVERNPVATRGEMPVFSELFADPYGSAALATSTNSTPEPPDFGVSKADVDRLGVHIAAGAAEEHDTKIRGSALVLTWGLASAGLTYLVTPSLSSSGSASYYGLSPRLEARILGYGLAGLLGVLSIVGALIPGDMQRMLHAYQSLNCSSEADRARSFDLTEEKLHKAAETQRGQRLTSAWSGLGLSVAYFVVGAAFARSDVKSYGQVLPSTYVVYGGLALVFLGGSVEQFLVKTPIERTWETYSHDPAVLEKWGAEGSEGVSVTPTVSVAPNGGAVFGLAGRF
jgi:hypothetical protein